MNNIKVNSIYKHYKGNQYKIISLAHYSEDPNKILVIYQGLYDCPTYGKNPIWARPLEMFLENIVLNNIETPRFKMIE